MRKACSSNLWSPYHFHNLLQILLQTFSAQAHPVPDLIDVGLQRISLFKALPWAWLLGNFGNLGDSRNSKGSLWIASLTRCDQ